MHQASTGLWSVSPPLGNCVVLVTRVIYEQIDCSDSQATPFILSEAICPSTISSVLGRWATPVGPIFLEGGVGQAQREMGRNFQKRGWNGKFYHNLET